MGQLRQRFKMGAEWVITKVGGRGTAGLGVVSEEEVGGMDRTEVQTEVGGGGTVRTMVVF